MQIGLCAMFPVACRKHYQTIWRGKEPFMYTKKVND